MWFNCLQYRCTETGLQFFVCGNRAAALDSFVPPRECFHQIQIFKMHDGYTEESFLLATFQEFVLLWNFGAQASINIQCEERKAWVQMTSSLGSPKSPKSPHSSRYAMLCDQSRKGWRQYRSYHGQRHAHPHLRRKGPRQLERDRTQAAAHRRRLFTF